MNKTSEDRKRGDCPESCHGRLGDGQLNTRQYNISKLQRWRNSFVDIVITLYNCSGFMSGTNPFQTGLGSCKKRSFHLRPAMASDGPAVIRLIIALAEFEKLPPPDEAGRARLLEHGFGSKPRFETWLAIVPEQEEPVGYALFFETYSTFEALPSLYLEDMFVLPQFRGLGIGTAFLRQCVRLAHERGCGRMEWTCLDWNKRAQCVYESLGAQPMKEWILYRLTREKIAASVANAPRDDCRNQ